MIWKTIEPYGKTENKPVPLGKRDFGYYFHGDHGTGAEELYGYLDGKAGNRGVLPTDDAAGIRRHRMNTGGEWIWF